MIIKPRMLIDYITLHQILRISLPSLLTIVLFALIVFAVYFPIVDRVIHEHEKAKIRELVHVVHQIMSRIHTGVENSLFSEEVAQRVILGLLPDLMYGEENRDYFWVHDATPRMIYHPHFDESDLSVFDNVDLEGRPLYVTFNQIAEEGGGFVEYEWMWVGAPNRIERKVAYLRLFEPWGWVIGTGYYHSDAHAKTAMIRQYVTYILIAALLIVIIISMFTIRQQWEHEKRHHAMQEKLQHSMKLEAVGKLAGGVAHDFNNILTVIEGYADLAMMRSGLDDALRKDLQTIRRAADRAESITRQLLAFSRQQIIAPRLINLNEIIPEVEQMLERILGEDIEISTVLDPNLGLIMADPNQIEQILMNLAANTRDAMPHGGQLTFETCNVRLDEKFTDAHFTLEAGEYVLLSVSDNGVGMDSTIQERIFEPFFTTKGVGKGTGLGLSTVYGIVKQNHGHISVYSEPSEGTIFKIYLPRIIDPSRESTAHITPIDNSTPSGTETILLVEDEMEVLRLTKATLEKHGYKVIATNAPLEAIQICENYPEEIHLLIADVIMPKLSGALLAQQVRSSRPHMKTLYMSGYTDTAIVHHGVLEPNIWFIQKPFQPSSFLQKVRKVLDSPPK